MDSFKDMGKAGEGWLSLMLVITLTIFCTSFNDRKRTVFFFSDLGLASGWTADE